MGSFRLVLRSLRFYWRTHVGVLVGTLIAAAILTGALLVGDSVDHSLRQHALLRLGKIHFALDAGNRFFDEDLAEGLQEHLEGNVSAALTLRGMALFAGSEGGKRTQINQVNVIGVDAGFWEFGPGAAVELGAYETAINERLALALGVGAGDEISLRVAKPDLLSRDAALSSRAEEPSTRALMTVEEVLPDEHLGRFSLAANQATPYNAFVNLEWLQEQVELSQRANLVLVGAGATQNELEQTLSHSWQPEHVGVRLRRHSNDTLQLETDHIFLDPAMADAALKIPGAAGTLTYLVNSISKGDRSTPYSFAVAGPAPEGMQDDEVVINRWLADQLGAVPGDELTVAYYELLPSNEFVEKERAFAVHRVAEMDEFVIEKDLAPQFPGLSDVESCADWDIGMPMNEELLKDAPNEVYWEEYGQTPKIVLTLAAGQELWGNRFGNLMAVRYSASTYSETEIREALTSLVDPGDIGLFFVPVRQNALDAVSQAMDLGGLFLGMSFFLIISAIILTSLLFVFGVQQRATEVGILIALGFRPGRVRRLFLAEAVVIAVLGAVGGAWLGTAYTRVLLFALSRFWQGAVAHASIMYHADAGTIFEGAGISVVCSLAALSVAMWRQTRHPARELLAMDFTQDLLKPGRRRLPGWWLPVCGLVLSVSLVVYVQVAEVDNVVLPFFGVGSLLLVSGLAFCRSCLARWGAEKGEDPPTLWKVALHNASRRRGRSLSVVALLATGSFLVLAVSTMQEDLASHAGERWSGTGGFELFAEATVPLTENPAARLDEPGLEAVSIRVRDGDDASCLNLNHAQTPRLLGVNVQELSEKAAFLPRDTDENLWDLLNLSLPDGVVPALVGDTDTLMWGLKKKVGVERGDVLEYRDDAGRDVSVKLVGALPMRLSVFQGTILISDEAFTRLYPSEDGFRMFLIDTPPETQHETATRLNTEFDRFGIDAVPAVERLQQFYVVESTYLAMFLVLGGLGMILGSAAMGVVVLRNLLERRREIAMLRAVGFRQRVLFRIFLTEYGLLLFMGLAVGGVAAAVSMVPAVTSSASDISLGLQAAVLGVVVLTGAGCIALAVLVGLGKGDLTALRDE